MTLFLFLTALGITLLVVEMMLPGAVAGFLGLLCLLIGIIFAFIEFGGETGFVILLIEMALGMVGFAFWVKYFPKSRMSRIWSLTGQPPEQLASKSKFDHLLGQEGIATTMLRPAGIVLIEGKRYDAVSEGGLIQAQSKVKVIKVEGVVIVVRAL